MNRDRRIKRQLAVAIGIALGLALFTPHAKADLGKFRAVPTTASSSKKQTSPSSSTNRASSLAVLVVGASLL
jgi:hypothetical protein